MVNIFEELQKPEAYEGAGKIRVMQTHISYVFLTGKYAYKVKKPVDFGFLDFTTLEKRKHYCEEEVRLNSRLSKGLYIGVVPITVKGNSIKVNGDGEVIEYAVKMREIPQEKTMVNLLKEGKVKESDILAIADIVYRFHEKADSGKEISKYGKVETVSFNWEENFSQTMEFIGKTIGKERFDFIERRVGEFMDRNAQLFQKRIEDGKVKECHGDLHSGNIFITDSIYIFDGIEFNERFKNSDVAADVAFFVMDMDFIGKGRFGEAFLERYRELSHDKALDKLMPFYKCYRAFVRGKVVSFRLNDKNISEKDKKKAEKDAKRYFELAEKYAKDIIC